MIIGLTTSFPADAVERQLPDVATAQRLVASKRPDFAELLAEPFIRGRELTVAVLGDRALCVTELRPKSGFYDFDAKYTDGMTEHVCPADIPDEITVRVVWRADFERQQVVMESRNLERLGFAACTLLPESIGPAMLDEFGRLVLGRPNTFRSFVNR